MPTGSEIQGEKKIADMINYIIARLQFSSQSTVVSFFFFFLINHFHLEKKNLLYIQFLDHTCQENNV